MKTRERILQTSLRLFNENGEPTVTTNHIADEMDISPGNLYYHFRNKDDIIYFLFIQFEQEISDVLEAPQSRALNMEDMWLYLHLVFESIWRYRFLYRDLDNILTRNRKIRLRFRRILDRKVRTAITICKGLVDAGIMDATLEEIDALSNNIAVVATYWLNFQRVRIDNRNNDGDIGQGVYQVITLVSPFLVEEMRDLLNKLSHDYLD
ncbi:MAG: TetR/AcrR family transcriptional regulator [Candidatus Competibacteraceae bacterium]|jgi:AcrR family transcriptional regulator|nr:TetR/AcrR family transcriptional regulator [Candidatus Competibacteraceae bacterium]